MESDLYIFLTLFVVIGLVGKDLDEVCHPGNNITHSKNFQKRTLDFGADAWPFVTTPISDKLIGSPNMPEWFCIPFEFWCRNFNSYPNDMDIITLLNLIAIILPNIFLIDFDFWETVFFHNLDDDEEEEEFDLIDIIIFLFL